MTLTDKILFKPTIIIQPLLVELCSTNTLPQRYIRNVEYPHLKQKRSNIVNTNPNDQNPKPNVNSLSLNQTVKLEYLATNRKIQGPKRCEPNSQIQTVRFKLFDLRIQTVWTKSINQSNPISLLSRQNNPNDRSNPVIPQAHSAEPPAVLCIYDKAGSLPVENVPKNKGLPPSKTFPKNKGLSRCWKRSERAETCHGFHSLLDIHVVLFVPFILSNKIPKTLNPNQLRESTICYPLESLPNQRIPTDFVNQPYPIH